MMVYLGARGVEQSWRAALPTRPQKSSPQSANARHVGSAISFKLCDPILSKVISTLLATDLPMGIVGGADTAGLRDSFEARGDVDAVAKDIVFVNDNIADVNADPEFDSAPPRHIGIARPCRAGL
jgi:hypothetical protein